MPRNFQNSERPLELRFRKSVIPIEMEGLWWNPLSKHSTIRFNNYKSKHRAFRKGNQKVPQKRFHVHYCLDGHSGIDDCIFEQCETHE